MFTQLLPKIYSPEIVIISRQWQETAFSGRISSKKRDGYRRYYVLGSKCLGVKPTNLTRENNLLKICSESPCCFHELCKVDIFHRAFVTPPKHNGIIWFTDRKPIKCFLHPILQDPKYMWCTFERRICHLSSSFWSLVKVRSVQHKDSAQVHPL